MSTCPVEKDQMYSGDWSVLLISNNGGGEAIAYERDFYLTVATPSTVTYTPTVCSLPTSYLKYNLMCLSGHPLSHTNAGIERDSHANIHYGQHDYLNGCVSRSDQAAYHHKYASQGDCNFDHHHGYIHQNQVDRRADFVNQDHPANVQHSSSPTYNGPHLHHHANSHHGCCAVHRLIDFFAYSCGSPA